LYIISLDCLNPFFDFVFSDADKDWYKNYFTALAPKLEVGGCFTAHHATNSGGPRGVQGIPRRGLWVFGSQRSWQDDDSAHAYLSQIGDSIVDLEKTGKIFLDCIISSLLGAGME
jgi:hypothetical protein